MRSWFIPVTHFCLNIIWILNYSFLHLRAFKESCSTSEKWLVNLTTLLMK